METRFPDHPGLSGALFPGWRRRAGLAAGPGSIEAVHAVAVKLAYQVLPSTGDPALGSLVPRPDGPPIFEADQQAITLVNPEFAEGLTGWTATGGASAAVANSAVTLSRQGAGDLRQDSPAWRQWRDRSVAISVEAQAGAGLTNPGPRLVAGGQAWVVASSPPTFPADGKPVLVTKQGKVGAVADRSLSLRLPTMGADGQEITYAKVQATSVEYESDLVPEKPEADIIVIADALPLPLSVAVNGTIRFSQEALPAKELTGLGWADRQVAPRVTDAGQFPATTQALPDAFENVFYNGYRRDRRQGGSVPHLAPGDRIRIERAGSDAYGFALPADRPAILHEWYVGEGPDDPALWKSRRVAMALDTLVVEPDRDHAYGVWRAAWAQDLDLDGTGPLPPDRNRRVTVVLEGG